MKYDYADYAASRLLNTVVRIKETNDLVHILHIDNDFNCHVQDMQGNTSNVHISLLNLKPPRLGYINRNNDCYYVSRIPKRQDWKQGMRYENLTIISDHGNPPTKYRYSDLVEMVKGSYPSLSECVKRVGSGKRQAMAFSHDFALAFCGENTGEPCVNLLYGGVGIVGTYNGSIFKLKDEYKYLKERVSAYESKEPVQSRSKKG